MGDTIRALLVSGGDALRPRVDSGASAEFVVRAFRMAKLADSTTRPVFALSPVMLNNKPVDSKLTMREVGVEYRIRSDSTAGTYYICVLRGSGIFVGSAEAAR